MARPIVEPSAIVHPTAILCDDVRIGHGAIIEANARIGVGTSVWHYALVRAGARVGRKCSIGRSAEIGPNVVVGDETRVGSGAQVHHGCDAYPTIIGDRVFIAPKAFLSNDKYPTLVAEFVPQGVIIEDDAVIAADASVVGGLRVCEGAVLGMGAVLTKVLPRGEIWYGNPATPRGRRVVHYPGCGEEHWGTLCEDEVCARCRELGVEQWRPEPGVLE